jgi:3'-5' exonuclease
MVEEHGLPILGSKGLAGNASSFDHLRLTLTKLLDGRARFAHAGRRHTSTLIEERVMADMSESSEETQSAGGSSPAYLLLDSESVPDGRLLGKVKYPQESLSDEEAVSRAQAEARELSRTGSDFIPVSFQVPVAVCVIRAAADFTLQRITPLGGPHFRPRDIVEQFWCGVAEHLKKHQRMKLVTFNGRGFDLPLLELAAFRYRLTCGRAYFDRSRDRFRGNHLDLLDWLTNVGANRLAGGLNLLSKILGKPGKMEVAGDHVYEMHKAGKIQEINDYCMFDTLDTYFVFLRTRVMTGEISGKQETDLVDRARAWIETKTSELPGLRTYLDNWGTWEPWP